jgi:hypothetical protein
MKFSSSVKKEIHMHILLIDLYYMMIGDDIPKTGT